MFNKDHLSDVKFVVFDGNGENESRQMIPAHKFILAISSPVFKAMFYGKLVETGRTIELPDCDYESLLELFRYMYSDEVNLSGSNVMKVLYLAKKYMVPSLANKCVKYVFGHLDASNVFNILPCAQKYDEKLLVDKCWKVIDEDAEAAMKSESFATIDKSLLEAVVERNTLDIAELKLFNRVTEWATKKFEEQGIVADGQQKRRLLGERVIKSIHFPVMTEELVKLHWLPISYHVVFKLLLLVFKALNGLGPRYLVELLQYQNHSRTLRSNFLEILLQQKSNTKTVHFVHVLQDCGTIFP